MLAQSKNTISEIALFHIIIMIANTNYEAKNFGLK